MLVIILAFFSPRCFLKEFVGLTVRYNSKKDLFTVCDLFKESRQMLTATELIRYAKCEWGYGNDENLGFTQGVG